MSKRIFERNGVTVQSYAGPARAGDRRRLQVDGGVWPSNTLSVEEVADLVVELNRWLRGAEPTHG